jgi:hypothetical protein
LRSRSSVVFPAPDGPTIEYISLLLNSHDTESIIMRLPESTDTDFDRFISFSIVELELIVSCDM